jgi:hypothetical protein
LDYEVSRRLEAGVRQDCWDSWAQRYRTAACPTDLGYSWLPAAHLLSAVFGEVDQTVEVVDRLVVVEVEAAKRWKRWEAGCTSWFVW